MKNLKNRSGLEDLGFDMSSGKFSELSAALHGWAESFYLGELEDAYSDEIAYLLYNMSKEMENIKED